jgi:hypothetical protein
MQQLADQYGVTPGDIRPLIAQYPGDVPLWEDAGVLSPEVSDDPSRATRHTASENPAGDSTFDQQEAHPCVASADVQVR